MFLSFDPNENPRRRWICITTDDVLNCSSAVQIQLLSEQRERYGSAGVLLEEVEMESERVWKFIIEREIESPDRFRAIQSYR